ncbi:hypothetical protein BKA64DRAFT_448559 [Cadophora sp. MPI-SDFR-AT-0126]|nr:hypothetical protein BKA64DRAFT_448559 [Leotiomycetes sp. MPI-SDFR-AT-0126]
MESDSEKNHSTIEMDCCERSWRQYPSDQASVDYRFYTDKLSDLGSDLFTETSEETDVEILDIEALSASGRPSRQRFCDSKSLDSYITKAVHPATRIISFHSQNSLGPLKVTAESLLRILSHYEIGTEFLDLLFVFGEKPNQADVGVGGLNVTHRADGSYDMCYLMVYAEESREKDRSSWPIRQTAVFHRFVPNSTGHLWIFIHPMPNSVLQQRLETYQFSGDEIPNCHWNLHLLAISSYIEGGRWYLRSLSDEFEDIADVALTLDFSRPGDYTEGFRTLTKLQYLQERILPLPARNETSIFTVRELQTVYALFRTLELHDDSSARIIQNSLSLFGAKYRGNLAGVEVLRSRVQGVIKLLSVALNLKNQSTSVDINHNMLLLTKDTVDDSATVRVVTLVTLIYLPASFISSLLGTNLFAFETTDGSGFQISRQFWIFIALSVPLTFLTVGSWFYISYKRRRNKALQERVSRNGRLEIEV